jgi:hypothetical protein
MNKARLWLQNDDQFIARRLTEFPCQNFLLSINVSCREGCEPWSFEGIFVQFKSLINYFYESIFDCCFHFCTILTIFNVLLQFCNYLHSISSLALPDRLLISSSFCINFSFERHNFSLLQNSTNPWANTSFGGAFWVSGWKNYANWFASRSIIRFR